MVVRELFHKAHWASVRAIFGLLALSLTATACTDADTERLANTLESETRVSGAETIDLGPMPPAGYAWVIFGADTVVAEVAATADERAQGLMYRDEVPDGTGMLFVFQDNQPRSFWMANTYVALDIAYMDPSYRIVDIIAMEPLVTDSYPSDAPAMFALEVRQGWFQEQGIAVGTQANIVFGVQGR
ncbi:MAG: DUF192 domain-containing protein [Gemmatimonadota bacterium]|nr:DUF192 domain-containing protein [Gemmatimonadota bacterium]MDE3005142.1 DUF192 domain-containing protein [Gemmatimonadota bacterium]MDE3012801.1 DUF192 domain-containing protein [Gemmatimonadota bacterium]